MPIKSLIKAVTFLFQRWRPVICQFIFMNKSLKLELLRTYSNIHVCSVSFPACWKSLQVQYQGLEVKLKNTSLNRSELHL